MVSKGSPVKAFYLTTPLYYVNAKPHLGHAYTTIVADCLARAHRQRGQAVFLLTGTDEHGEKVAQAAQAKGMTPQAFADETSQTFKALWKTLGISHDHFIRTTDQSHQAVVQKVLVRLKENGSLRPGTYTFWYCVPCETSYALGDFKEPARKACPTCGRETQELTEEDFFLDLEAHRPWLTDHIRAHPGFIRPEGRGNEVLGLLEKPLPALCVTRPKERVSWGIPVPFSPDHVTYVWFDALLNYISALGWPDGEPFKTYWEEAGAIHLIGKDILRHHALYWPIILRAAGIPPPRSVFAHGWWMIQGEKMSKSKGNIVEPEAVVAAYGRDLFRYFLLRDVPFGEDGVFSEQALVTRLNADLANDLGNLVYRTLTMLEKHAQGRIPPGALEPSTKEAVWAAQEGCWAALNQLKPDQALKAVWELVARANLSVERKAPWTLAREGKREELAQFLYQLGEILKDLALLVWPFMPDTGEQIWRQLGLDSALAQERLPAALEKPIPTGRAVRKGPPLFPRLEM